jgi:hypothetical protein
MGKPSWGNAQLGPPEHIGWVQGTRGTETSQYPEEEKATAIPRVVVSERGSSLNRVRVKPAGVAYAGSWDHPEEAAAASGSYQSRGQQNRLENLAKDGKSPVCEVLRDSRMSSRVGRGPRNPVRICEDHLVRLNTSW